MNMENNKKRIEIATVFGKLIAQISGDPTYLGIYILLEQDDEDTGGKYDRQLALVEATPNSQKEGKHSLRLLAWNSDDEDFTDKITFYEWSEEDASGAKEESDEVKWEKYLQYIKEWADSHKEAGFLGCAPACYDEWIHAEYAESLIS